MHGELEQPVLAPVSDEASVDGSITPGLVDGIIHVIAQLVTMVHMA